MKKIILLSLTGLLLSFSSNAQKAESDSSKKEYKAAREKPVREKVKPDTTKPTQRITVNEEGVGGKSRKGKKTVNQVAAPEGGNETGSGTNPSPASATGTEEKKKKKK